MPGQWKPDLEPDRDPQESLGWLFVLKRSAKKKLLTERYFEHIYFWLYRLMNITELSIQGFAGHDNSARLSGNASTGSDPKEYGIFDSSMPQQFDDFVEEDSHWWISHSVGYAQNLTNFEHWVPVYIKDKYIPRIAIKIAGLTLHDKWLFIK